MKRVLIALVMVIGSGISAAIYAADPAFSLHNKSGFPIRITLSLADKSGTRELVTKALVQPEAFYDYDYVPGSGLSTLMLAILDQQGQQVYKVGFPYGKTAYVNWGLKDGSLKVYPQRGPYLGTTGKTDLGYSTKNNVEAIDIGQIYTGASALKQLEKQAKEQEAMLKRR